MDYPTSVAYNYNEVTKEYNKCYPLTHMNAVYTKDDESETLGNKLADVDNALKENLNKIGVLNTSMENVNTQLSDIMKDSIRKDYPFFATGFNGHDGEKLDMYISYKDDLFIPINPRGLLEGMVRDPSPIFYNNKFYIAYTNHPGFCIAVSEDLVNWEINKINIYETGLEQCIAPQFFKDTNGDIYIILSYTNGETDSSNNGIYIYQTRLLKALDDTLLNWGNEITVSFSDSPSNIIDTCILKVEGIYHLWTKYEPSGVIAHYTSTSLANTFQYQDTVPFKMPCEGISVIYKNNQYIMYADIMSEGRSTLIYSNDLNNWTNEIPLSSSDGGRTQHFDLFQLDINSQSIVNSAIKKYSFESSGSKLSLNRYGARNLKISDYLSGTIFNPPIFNGAIYTLDDDDVDTITISEINVPNPQKHYDFYFMVTRGSSIVNQDTMGILLKYHTVDEIVGNGALRTPNYSDFLIGKSFQNVLVHMIYLGKDYTSKNKWVMEGIPVLPSVNNEQQINLTPTNSFVRTTIINIMGKKIVNLYFSIPASSLSAVITTLGSIDSSIAPPHWFQGVLTIDGNANSANNVIPYIEISSAGVLTLALNTLTGATGNIQGGCTYIR